MGRAPNVVTTVELDDTLDVDVTGIDVPLTPSPNTKLANSDEDEEINSPTTNHLRTTCHLPLISIGDSTSGFRFYDDDEQEEEIKIEKKDADVDESFVVVTVAIRKQFSITLLGGEHFFPS